MLPTGPVRPSPRPARAASWEHARPPAGRAEPTARVAAGAVGRSMSGTHSAAARGPAAPARATNSSHHGLPEDVAA